MNKLENHKIIIKIVSDIYCISTAEYTGMNKSAAAAVNYTVMRITFTITYISSFSFKKLLMRPFFSHGHWKNVPIFMDCLGIVERLATLLL